MPVFGTDGIRGIANAELTPELAVAVGRAAVTVLGGGRWLVGADTRASSPMLVAALSAGLASGGADVADLGVVPTPAVAFAGERLRAPAAMISASHNPWTDNGIKLLAAGGRKLDADAEARVLGNMAVPPSGTIPAPGRISRDPDPMAAYRSHLLSSLGGRRLDGLSLVVDCANGAASGIAPDVLRAAGADVTALFAEPDGVNINRDCGSTHPQALQAAVVERSADAGLAFDGDADRVIAVDHTGALVDGDQIIAVCALDRAGRGHLPGNAVAVTVMSNLGLRLALAAAGITVVETPVGDRHVLAALDDGGLVLGGEQSGHVIFRDLATTGDGLLTGLQLLDVVVREGRPLADLASAAMRRLPQVLRNVVVDAPGMVAAAERVQAAVAKEEGALPGRGRILLRPSGTEPLVRVMVEAESEELAATVAGRLVAAVTAAADAATDAATNAEGAQR